MSKLMVYQGYNGTIEYSAENNIFYGQVIGIRGLISYEGNNLESLRNDFEETIDSYLSCCEEEGIEPMKPYKIPNETIEESLKSYIMS